MEVFDTFDECRLQFFNSQSALSIRQIKNGSDARLVDQLTSYASIFPSGDPRHRYFKILTSVAPFRALEWAESRRCILDVLEALRKQGFQLSEVLLSLSHTKEYTIAVGAIRGPHLVGIGVDLEDSKRKMSLAAAKSFLTPQDWTYIPPLSPLHFWVIKEACYKANPENSNTLIPNYSTSSLDLTQSEGQMLNLKQPSQKFHFKWHEAKGLTIAFAKLSAN